MFIILAPLSTVLKESHCTPCSKDCNEIGRGTSDMIIFHSARHQGGQHRQQGARHHHVGGHRPHQGARHPHQGGRHHHQGLTVASCWPSPGRLIFTQPTSQWSWFTCQHVHALTCSRSTLLKKRRRRKTARNLKKVQIGRFSRDYIPSAIRPPFVR